MARGGYRPGAGRPKGAKTKNPKKAAVCSVATKKPKRQEAPPVVPDDVTTEAEAQNLDPLTYMLKIMNDDKAEKERRDRMAIAAAPFVHSRKGEGKGKKEQKADRAKAAGSGKFAPAKPPLALVK